MSFIYFFFLALITIILSIKISYYVDRISQINKRKGFLVTGILLSGITSLPELVTSISAIRINNPYLAIGDILGSNTFNIFMISIIDIFFIKNMLFNKIKKKYKVEYISMLICYTIIYLYIVINPSLTILSIGLPSFVLIISYIIYILKLSKPAVKDETMSNQKMPIIRLVLCAISLIICSYLLTLVANQISIIYPSISGSVIGALFLGITTSLPEVITFIILVKLENYDMALTGILGSNIFNLFVLAINDLIIKGNNLYLFADYGSILLIRVLITITTISFINVLRKGQKSKLFYSWPSIIIIILYGLFLIKGVAK